MKYHLAFVTPMLSSPPEIETFEIEAQDIWHAIALIEERFAKLKSIALDPWESDLIYRRLREFGIDCLEIRSGWKSLNDAAVRYLYDFPECAKYFAGDSSDRIKPSRHHPKLVSIVTAYAAMQRQTESEKLYTPRRNHD